MSTVPTSLTQAEVVEILAACPTIHPRELSLTEFHSALAEGLAVSSSRLAKRVLGFGKEQVSALA